MDMVDDWMSAPFNVIIDYGSTWGRTQITTIQLSSCSFSSFDLLSIPP
jgi:hypothetical protein